MKSPSLKAASFLALAVLLIPAFAKETFENLSAENTTPIKPCGNPDYAKTPYCEKCEDGVMQYFTPEAGSSCDTNSIHAYNGNAHREITDLLVSGSPGTMPLAFKRFSNTRLSSRNLAHSAFGSESSWSHNFEWVVRDSGGTPDRPIIKITYPQGDEMTFQRWSATSPSWFPVSHRNPDRIVASGDDFVLHTAKHEKFGFKRRLHSVTGGVFYRLETITDPAANTTAISYDNNDDTHIRQVTDPAGRWIKLHYQDITLRASDSTTLAEELLPAGSTNTWKEITLTPGESFRILALHQGNTWRQKMALRVAELEFYDQNNARITGTAFGSWPWKGSNTPARAMDGNDTTYYEYQYEKAGFVGIDLGAGNAKQVSRIRYRLTGTLNTDASVAFVGMNNEAVPDYVVSHIQGSDGRDVGYDYSVFTEPSGTFQWVQLTAANYPDLTASTYGYKWQHRHTMPVLEKAGDPRYEGSVKRVRYGYDLNTVVGFVTDEYDDASGKLIVSVRWDGAHIPKLVYPNGKVNRFEYANGNLMRSINSFGGITDYTHTWRGYVLTEDDPLGRTTTYTRNDEGRILSVTTPGDSVTAYTLDGDGRITATTRNGRATSHIRDGRKLITRTNHPDGTYETWSYNTFGQPLTHRQRNGASESWDYDPSGLKKSHTDAMGAVTTYHHFGDPGIIVNRGPITANVAGRLAYIADAHGNTTSFRYNDRGQVTRETRTPGGNITHGGSTVQDSSGDFTVTTDYTYDDYGNLIARAVNTTDPNTTGRLWIYDYDSLGRIIREVDPLGRETFTSYDLGTSGCGSCGTSAKPVQITEPGGTITRFTYDKEWRMLTTTRAFGTAQAATTTNTYDIVGQRITMEDPMGHITRWEYDADGRVLTETRADGTPIASITRYGYDIHGNRLTVTDPVGAITHTTYDTMDRPLNVTRAWNTTDALATKYNYSATNGRLLNVKDNLNRPVAFEYDNLDRVIKTTLPDGNFTQTFYDLLGRNYKSRDLLGNHPSRVFDSSGQAITSTDAAGVTASAYYNGHGDLTATVLPSGKSVAYQHDIAGNTIKTILAPGTAEQTVISEILTRDPMLRPLTVKDGEGSVTAYTYDLLGRTLSSSLDPENLNLKTHFTYNLDGQLHTVREADNIQAPNHPVNTPPLPNSTRTYDALHRLKTERDGKNQLIEYFYDAAGRMTSYKDAKLATFSFQYDLLGRLKQRTEPDFTVQAYTYDKAGRLKTHTKADGKTKTHHYENANRDELTRTTYSNGEPQRTYTYTASGQPLTASNANSTITWGYDSAGRRTSETQALQGVPGTHTFSYQFDGDGNLARHIRPDGSAVDYAYNPRNLIAGITAGTADPVARYTYNGRNQLEHTETEVGSALFTSSRSYDAAGRLTSLVNRTGKLPTLGATLDTTSYGLTADGRRETATRNGQVEDYGYDTARQVTSASYGGLSATQSWNYDAAGNRSSATTNGTTTSYFANLVNEYTSWSGGILPPSHDANGNQLTTYAGATLEWDINNQLASASKSSGDSTQYQYDALGRRTKRTETISSVSTSTWFLTNGWNVELEYESGAYARRMTWGQDLSQSLQGAGGVGGLVMTEELPPGGGAPVPSFPTYDGNGNITAWVNASGTVTARQRYDAFGNIIEQTGTAPSRYGFSTKPIELVTGFLYYGYRYYDPMTGRWPSRDPIEERGGVNLYGFVGNNSIKRSDYLGLDDTITVEHCEVKIVPGHGGRPRNTFWKMKGCSLGGFAGCYPGTNNPPNPVMRADDVPDGHDNKMAQGNGDNSERNRNNQEHQRDSWNESSGNPNYVPGERPEPKWEHGVPESIDNMTDPDSIQKNVEKLCKCQCKSVKVTLELSDAGDEESIVEGINNRSKRFKTWDGSTISKSFTCGGSGPYTFP